jgi:hypothetical protein
VIEDERNSFPAELQLGRAVREAELTCFSKGIREGTSLVFAECCELIANSNHKFPHTSPHFTRRLQFELCRRLEFESDRDRSSRPFSDILHRSMGTVSAGHVEQERSGHLGTVRSHLWRGKVARKRVAIR